MNLTKKQHEAMLILAQPWVNFLVYGGAVRGAKTYWLIILFFRLAKEFPLSRWALVRASRPRITENLLPAIRKVAEDPEFAPYITLVNEDRVRFSNKSEVILFAESFSQDPDGDRFRGLEVNGFGLDEISEQQPETLQRCFERAGAWLNSTPNIHGEMPKPIVVATCNPTRGWVKTDIYDKWVDGTLPRSWAYVPAKVTDNPFIPKSYILNLWRQLTYANFKRFVAGDWEYVEKTGKEWIHAFNYDKHCTTVEYIHRWPVKLSFDFNTLPYVTMLCSQVINIDNVVYVRFFKEYTLAPPFADPESACRAFINDYIVPFGYTSVEVYGDASGKHGYNAYNRIFEVMNKYLPNEGDQVRTKNPVKTDARDMVNNLLAEKKFAIKIEIDPVGCPNLVVDLDTMQTGPDGFNNEKVRNVETKGHCYSALVYELVELFPEALRENAEY